MKSRETELLLIYLAIDLAVLNLAIFITAYFNFNFSELSFFDFSIYALKGNVSWIITYFVFSKQNLYLRDDFSNRLIRITKRTLIFLGVSSVITFLIMPHGFSRIFFLEYAIVFYLLKLLVYFLLYRYLHYVREKGLHVNRVVIAGINETSEKLRTIIDSNPMMGFKFIGYVSDWNVENIRLLGPHSELVSILEKHKIQMLLVSQECFNSSKRGNEYLRICNKMGIRVRYIPENQSWYKNHANIETVGDIVLINPQEIPLDKLGNTISKRIFDIVFSSLFLLLIFSWMYPILALLIKLSSKGPVFFIQKRTGYNNRPFNCFKFRSMSVNHLSNLKQATANDSRITPIGRFMRKTNLDEMPQFLNVLLGKMSVVGPRPHMLKHTEEYSALIDHYLIRHYVKPGITGWAQVNGYRGETDELWKMEKRVKYDNKYIENWTFWWDIKIIWQTTFGKKAYLNAG